MLFISIIPRNFSPSVGCWVSERDWKISVLSPPPSDIGMVEYTTSSMRPRKRTSPPPPPPPQICDLDKTGTMICLPPKKNWIGTIAYASIVSRRNFRFFIWMCIKLLFCVQSLRICCSRRNFKWSRVVPLIDLKLWKFNDSISSLLRSEPFESYLSRFQQNQSNKLFLRTKTVKNFEVNYHATN